MLRVARVLIPAMLALAAVSSGAQTPPPTDPAVTPPAAAPAPAAPATGAPAPADSSAAPASAEPAAADPAAAAEPAAAAPDTRALDEQIQTLKKDAVDLNRELFMLEEELLFPANTQVALFLSMDVGEYFAIDTVQVKIDNKEVSNYLYTPREAEALLRGGVQRLYLGNLKVGDHELVAIFTGKGPNERDYRRGAALRFKKSVGAKYLELKISDRQRRAQPEFEIKDWE